MCVQTQNRRNEMAKRDLSKIFGGASGKAASAIKSRKEKLDEAIDGPKAKGKKLVGSGNRSRGLKKK
jgi:hypothetical protein